MAGGDNAESKYGEKRMEEEEGVNVRTVDCLRGRLLAERMASKNAHEEADKLGNKMKRLEKLLEQEAKSRKRAEKRLKSVMKKLESLNITYYNASSGDESCLVDNKSEVSSVSSLASSNSTSKEHHRLHPQENARFGKGLVACEETEMGTKQEENSNPASIKSGEFEQQVIADEGFLSFEKSTQVGSAQACSASKMYEHDHSDDSNDTNVSSMRGEEINQEDDGVDNSMALVPIDVQVQQEVGRIDPQVLDNTVKEVLDALKYAKQQLQSSMEKRRRGNMIRVG